MAVTAYNRSAGVYYPVVGATGQGGVHATAGLDATYGDAVDIFAPAGSTVLAPERAVVTRVSGGPGPRGSSTGGYNVYLTGQATGRRYFLTHIEPVDVRPGQVVAGGQPIARVGGGYSFPPHLHIGTDRGIVELLAGAFRGGSVPATSPVSLVGLGPRLDVPGDLFPSPEMTPDVLENLLEGAVEAIFGPIVRQAARIAMVAGGAVLVGLGLILLGRAAQGRPSARELERLVTRIRTAPGETIARELADVRPRAPRPVRVPGSPQAARVTRARARARARASSSSTPADSGSFADFVRANR